MPLWELGFLGVVASMVALFYLTESFKNTKENVRRFFGMLIVSVAMYGSYSTLALIYGMQGIQPNEPHWLIIPVFHMLAGIFATLGVLELKKSGGERVD